MSEGLIYLGIAILLDIVANICLKRSGGFKNKRWGYASVALIILAFILMSQAVKTMDLSIAYALWGALGLILTTGIDVMFFGVRLTSAGFAGIICMLTGVVLIKSVA